MPIDDELVANALSGKFCTACNGTGRDKFTEGALWCYDCKGSGSRVVQLGLPLNEYWRDRYKYVEEIYRTVRHRTYYDSWFTSGEAALNYGRQSLEGSLGAYAVPQGAMDSDGTLYVRVWGTEYTEEIPIRWFLL